MNPSYLIQARRVISLFALLAILWLALRSNLQLFQQEAILRLKFVSGDGITNYDQLIAGLRKALPEHGVIGYLTHLSPEAIESDGDAVAEYYLTQYALTPLVVAKSPSYPLVFGNFRHGAPDPKIIASNDLTLVNDLGNGVMLFSREIGVASISQSNVAPAYAGFHSGADCEEIYGWAWNRQRPNSQISVDIYDGDKLLATVKADRLQQKLLDAGVGNGYYGFSYPVPASLKDRQTHSVSVRFSGTEEKLSNTPKLITCSDALPVYEGFHDGVANCKETYGWAWDSSQPDNPVSVDIYDGVTLLATVKANVFRQDLIAAGKGNGYHGFSYTLPPDLQDGRSHLVVAKYSRTNTNLASSPKQFTCAANSRR
jgi:hypothetical protein